MSEDNDIIGFFNSILQDNSSKLKTFVMNEQFDIWKITNKHNLTGLGYAVANNKEEASKILLTEIKKRKDFSQEKYKLWLEGQDDQSRPLIMTAIKGFTSIMKLLLLSGAEITKKEGCLDVLHVAAIHNNSEFLENYINYINTTSWKLNINVTDSEGNSAIHLAVKKDDIRFQEVIKVLLNFGADINLKNNNSETPLQIAYSNENNNLIKFLLSYNVDLYSQNQQGETLKELLNKNCHFDDDISLNVKRLLFSAVKNNDHEKLKTFLSDEYLDVMNIVDESEAYEYTMLHSAVFHSFYDQVVLQINYLKKRYDNHLFNSFINSKSKEGFTPILLAAYKGNIEIIKLLIENGGDYRQTNKSGLSVLHMAAQGNQPSVIVFFKEIYNKDINEKDNVGSTVLHWSCYSESLDVLNLLFSYNTAVDMQDGEGNTPLLLSITFGKNCIKLERLRIIKKLIQYGADKEIKNNNGENAITIVKKKNLPALNEIFLQNPYPLSNIYFKKPPIEKLEGTRQNIFFFIIIHLVIAVLASVCIIKPILLHSHFGFYLSYMYYLLFITIMGLFTYLVYSDPGKIVNPKKITLMVLINIIKDLVESNEDLKKYCLFCAVKNTKSMKHCIICNVCIDGFDHHCYWINNCVGTHNYYQFMIFIFLIISNIILNMLLGFGGLYFECKYERGNKLYKLIFDIMIIGICFIFLVPVANILRLNFKCLHRDSTREKTKIEDNELKTALLQKEKNVEEKYY